MARYIDVDKLMEECKNHTMDEVYPEWKDKKVFDALCQMGHMFKKIIEEAPTADIEEVKHGYWITTPQGFCTCSECRTEGSPQWKRCPLCEAKMDKENTQ